MISIIIISILLDLFGTSLFRMDVELKSMFAEANANLPLSILIKSFKGSFTIVALSTRFAMKIQLFGTLSLCNSKTSLLDKRYTKTTNCSFK